MIKNKGAILCIVYCLFVAGSVVAQQTLLSDSGRIYTIDSRVHVGTILNNNAKAQLLEKDNPWLVQLDFSVLKNTKRAWDYNNCYSQTGVSLSYINFGNLDKLGRAINLLAFTEPYLIMSSKVRFTMRGGAGFAFLNKVYDAQYDSNNLFYSKPLSFILNLGTSFKYRISSSMAFNLSAQFTHISNGGSRWPNWGMNTPFIGVGIGYAFQPDNLKKRTCSLYDGSSWKIITHILGGRNTADANKLWQEEKRLVMGLNLGIIKSLGKTSAIGAGGEVYYDGIASVEKMRTDREFRSGIGSISIQHYLTFGKLLLGQQLAYYVTKTNPDVHSKLYQRYFIEYEVKGPLYFGVSLKAHSNVSDFLTLSTGYIFNIHSMK